uniref:C2 domain-containing protein n=1 Tax=Odontella aurita TaxID=265563 RepID=A0A7S4MN01_9STRA
MTEHYMPPLQSRGLRWLSGSDVGVKTLVENLSLGVQYDFCMENNHMNLSVSIPLSPLAIHDAKLLSGIESVDLHMDRPLLPTPTVCKTAVRPSRKLGLSVVTVIFSKDYLKLAAQLLQGFVSEPAESEDKAAPPGDAEKSARTESTATAESEQSDFGFSVSTRISGMKVLLSDPTLGMHHPIAVICLPRFVTSASQLLEPSLPNSAKDSALTDLQAVVDAHVWVDFFKLGATRSWEPLVEPYNFMVLYEKSAKRGKGMTFTSDCPFHVNVSGSLLETLDDTIESFTSLADGVFGLTDFDGGSNFKYEEEQNAQSASLRGIFLEEEVDGSNGCHVRVGHRVPRPLKSGSRVAFSLSNRTGEVIRLHRQSEFPRSSPSMRATLSYVHHGDAAKLSFPATESVVKNLRVVEVMFEQSSGGKGTKRLDARRAVDVQVPGFKWVKGISVGATGKHFKQLIPRFLPVREKVRQNWRLGNAISLLAEVDSSINGGTSLSVASPFVLQNETSHPILLTIHPDPRHQPRTLAGPPAPADDEEDPSLLSDGSEACSRASVHEDNNDYEAIGPGDTYDFPLLLLESSLHLDGSHLGSFWLQPDQEDELGQDILGPHTSDSGQKSHVGFSSRPVQLAKLVHESAVIFETCDGDTSSAATLGSGIEVSCPIVHHNDEVSASPFCYVVEVRRSPLVRPFPGHDCQAGYHGTNGDTSMTPHPIDSYPDTDGNADGSKNAVGDERKREVQSSQSHHVHGPVAYSLFVHPPIILENLLPEGGRFELMHATRRVVVWWADLKAGEVAPVHTVGLDAPLLLLINLGFCRTPVGEGALVHHGSSDKGPMVLNPILGWQSLGKVVKSSKQRVKKTLKEMATISETSGERGMGRVAKLKSPKQHQEEYNPGNRHFKQENLHDDAEEQEVDTLGFDIENDHAAGGRTHKSREKFTFGTEDIATETAVVDSLGQRLNLGIENILGGGGQRKITLFSPYWILNTTEHSLRYKQEKTSAYVSGTVIDSKRDGSKPVDGSNRNYVNMRASMAKEASAFDRGTIFAGTPGALATNDSGKCTLAPHDVASLMNKDLALENVAKMAFMFNYHDVLSLGNQKLSVQLADTTERSKYTSDWSSGFSLDSVGVTQVVGMHCKDGRSLEISGAVSVAPGRLSQFTKIVRFCPRYILVNHLNRPIRIWQDNSLIHSNYSSTDGSHLSVGAGHSAAKWRQEGQGHGDETEEYELLFGGAAALDHRPGTDMQAGTNAHRSALYISTAGPSELVPFHLPDTRSDRQLRADLGPTWNLTASWPADIAGEYTLKMMRALDLRVLRHVTTRAAPRYRIVLPPPDSDAEQHGAWDGELGIWFETDWSGGSKIVVKRTKTGKFAYNSTDVHVGDELLQIDDKLVSSMTFSETMKFLKDRLSAVLVAQKRGGDSGKKKPKPKFLLGRNRGTAGGTPARGSPEDNIALYGDTGKRLVLTFRTLEERMRRIRHSALSHKRFSHIDRLHSTDLGSGGQLSIGDDQNSMGSDIDRDGAVQVDMKFIHQSIYLVVCPSDKDNPPYRVENRSKEYFVYFRQRALMGHPWHCLAPGESAAYMWEEPIKPKKLTVRVGLDLAIAGSGDMKGDEEHSMMNEETSSIASIGIPTARKARKKRKVYGFNFVENEEQGGYGPTKTIKLEEIGYNDSIPCPTRGASKASSDNVLSCDVDTEGATRTLIVSDRYSQGDESEQKQVQEHLWAISKQIHDEEIKILMFKELRGLLYKSAERDGSLYPPPVSSSLKNDGYDNSSNDGHDARLQDTSSDEHSNHAQLESDMDLPMLEKEIRSIADYPEGGCISSCHQVLVEVIEAAELKAGNVNGLSNPYAEVSLKSRSNRKGKNLFAKKELNRRTYYIEQTLSPKWSHQPQIFVFNVPPEAAEMTRGHTIKVKLRSFGVLGSHTHLGTTEVHLRSLKNQRELVGWYPLMSRSSGRSELTQSLSSRVRGSVRLRVQWIYSVPALLDYYCHFSKYRIRELAHSKEGMEHQLKGVLESAKKKKDLRLEPLNLVRLPTVAGVIKRRHKPKASKRSSMHRQKDQKSGRDALDTGRRTESAVDVSLTAVRALNRGMRAAKEKYLWSMYQQTTESRQMRRTMMTGTILTDTMLVSNSVSEKNAISFPSPGGPVDGSRRVQFLSPKHLPRGQRATINSNGISGISTIHEPSTHVSDTINSVQGFSRDGGSGFGESLSLTQHTEILDDASIEEQYMHNLVDFLHGLGFLYHPAQVYFHRHRMTHHQWTELSFQSPVSVSDDLLQHRVFLRFPEEISQLKSWVIAQVLLNDDAISTHFNGDVAPKHISTPKDRTSADSGNNNINLIVLPRATPALIRQRAAAFTENLLESRASFESAAKRSLRSVLNLGGWLTIRPVTALNLPETFNGMFVKVRYGSEVIVSDTADAKVTPTWTMDKDVNMSPMQYYSGMEQGVPELNSSRSTAHPMDGKGFLYKSSQGNDLNVYVEPLKTSGSVRLSVVGERLQSNIELGVLQINLASAISCCNEHLPHNNTSDAAPYIMWFPLMSPRDCTPTEGDMGLCTRAPESEKTSDHLFGQYFAPCIKLALIWQPDNVYEEQAKSNKEDICMNSFTESYFQAYADSLSAALIDSSRAAELLSLSCTDLDIRYSVTKTKTSFGCAVGWIQLDQQHEKAREPVVLAPTPVINPQPTFQLLALRDDVRSKAHIDSFEHIAVELQELDLRVEEAWIFDLWEFLIRVLRRREAMANARKTTVDLLDSWKPSRSDAFTSSIFLDNSSGDAVIDLFESLGMNSAGSSSYQDDQAVKKIYIKELLLGFVKINLSYIKSAKARGTFSRDESAMPPAEDSERGEFLGFAISEGWTYYDQVEDKMSRQAAHREREIFRRWSEDSGADIWAGSTDSFAQRNLPHLISAVFPTITNAPIRLQGKHLGHVFETSSEIAASLKDFYVDETLKQFYKLVGSLDFVGNPAMVFSSFADGFRDFFAAPTRELRRRPNNPSRLGIGVAKGTLSLISHGAAGIFGWASKFSATIGQAAVTLSMDEHYKQWHSDKVTALATNYRKRQRKSGRIIINGITRPLGDIVSGFAFGASGIITEPYRGVKKDGAKGLAKGMGIATVGVVAKPLVGVFDAFAHFTESIHDFAQNVNILDKKLQPVRKLRLPYTFGIRNVLVPFNPVNARCMFLLLRHPLAGKSSSTSNSKRFSDSWGGEFIILSEVLHIEPGMDRYIVLTTRRIVLFKLKIEGGGNLVSSVEWQSELNDDIDIVCSLESRGHNGVVLYITCRSRFSGKTSSNQTTASHDAHGQNIPSEKSNQDVTREHIDEALRQSASLVRDIAAAAADPTGDVRQDHYNLEKMISSENAQQSSTPVSRNLDQHVRWKDAITLDHFPIEGDFHHRPELARMHNAICCVTGRFDSVLYEGGIGAEGSKEGYTSFGSMHFDEDKTGTKARNRHLERDFYSALEETPWLHNADISMCSIGKAFEKQSLYEARKTWLFSDEMAESTRGGGPEWRVAARAHGMFVPLPLPPLPSNVDSRGEDVNSTRLLLRKGLITFVDASDRLSSLQLVSSLEHEQSQLAHANASCDLVHTPVPHTLTDVSASVAASESTALTDTSPHPSSQRDESEAAAEMDQKLDRVTNLLEQLAMHMGANVGLIEDMAAAPSTNASVPSEATTQNATEEEKLRKEIQDLKAQLAVKETRNLSESSRRNRTKMPVWLKKVKRKNSAGRKHDR